ncbi:DNA glycosylase [Niveomyces insectorum RCEF 264]|uniref:DNA-(apurinic or apyrimidinic site) lyase n=1 Tax=Niveomyces insectorum RCEF 264 TaxID=1081102 RepID=A0A167WZL8_9HYPO|nr:DNA glycosylase [Niveomyces insectorum RCEF 264]
MRRLSLHWQALPVSPSELCIDTILRCGQSFRWKKANDEWRCSLHGRIVSLKQDANHLYFKTTVATKRQDSPVALAAQPAKAVSSLDDTEELLHSYFNLQLNLGSLYDQWSQNDVNFRKKAPKFHGIRILNQDAWETLICFICSSNNNIPRISQMAHKLCLHYGPFLGSIDGEDYHDFPSPEALARPGVESHLRQLGFGYRAKYIAQTAQTIAAEKPPGWLAQLRNAECSQWPGTEQTATQQSTYKAAHEQLLSLSGVGPKVADCVCLMGLGWGEAVPVDTHVWQIAVRDYKFKGSASKTFSKAMYEAVGDYFRSIWGTQAGWAQSVLFTANLKAFSDRLEAKVNNEPAVSVASTSRTKKRVIMEVVQEAAQTNAVPKKRRRNRGST